MSKFNLLLFVSLAVILLTIISYNNWDSYQERIDKLRGYTDVNIVKVFEYGSDIIASGYTISREVDGSCHVKSVVNPRPDAFQCTVNNVAYDPCFLDSRPDTHTKVACLESPWDESLLVINLKSPLPHPVLKEAGTNFLAMDPWAVELEGGVHCLMNGIKSKEATSLAGLVSRSFCFAKGGKESGVRIFSSIDRSKPFWVGFTDDVEKSVTTSKVNIAYY